MDSIDYNALAKTRYTDQHRFDAVFDAIIQTVTTQRMQRQAQYQEFADTFLDIDKSKGKALDVIGKIVGQKRELGNFINRPYFGFQGARLAQEFNVGYWYNMLNPPEGELKILNDEEYRRLIKARIIKNRTNNTRNDLLQIMNYLTGNQETRAFDVSHGVIRLTMLDESGIAAYFLNKRYDKDSIIPIPLGYRLITKYRQITRRKFTSYLYPIEWHEEFTTASSKPSGEHKQILIEEDIGVENLAADISVVRGWLGEGNLENSFIEAYNSDLDILSGNLVNALQEYDSGHDEYRSDLTFVEGLLRDAFITFDARFEEVSSSIDAFEGSLKDAFISVDTGFDEFSSDVLVVSGELYDAYNSFDSVDDTMITDVSVVSGTLE